MDLKDYIINSYADNVKNLPDYPSDEGWTPAQLKALFDGRSDKEIKNAINAILGVLKCADWGGNRNAGVGHNILKNNITGTLNTGIGIEALYANTSGSENTALGTQALAKVTTGNQNTAVGIFAGFNNVTGSNNVAIGKNALNANSSGDGNVALGYGAGIKETGSNKFYVHNKGVSNIENGKTTSLMYGEFAASADSTAGQVLNINADLNIPADKIIKIGNAAVALSGEADAALALKVDKVSGKDLSTNDYSDTEKNKVTNATNHLSNTANPHSVTKVQVGLGNVDDTSDANKPVSIATQIALNSKADKVAGKSLVLDTEITKLSGIEANADVTDAMNVGSSIHGAPAKTTMADTDKLGIIDTVSGNLLKTLSWAYVKSILKTYFDTVYLKLAGGTLTGALIAKDHGTAASAEVINACYGTSATPPIATSVPEGTLYIQYTA